MNKGLCSILVATQLMGGRFAVAQTDARPATKSRSSATPSSIPPIAGTSLDRSNPAISVSPRGLDFASVRLGATKNLTFTVRNVGQGILTGTAKVSAPFRIVGGGTYVLGSSQSQVITVQYEPKATGLHMTVVLLTGGGGSSVTVAGSGFLATPALRRAPAAPIRPASPIPPTGPAPPQNLRLFAGR